LFAVSQEQVTLPAIIMTTMAVKKMVIQSNLFG